MSVEPLLSSATASVVPPSTATTNAPPQTVIIPIDQLNAFAAMQARLAKVEEEQQRRDEAARVENIKVLAAKGQVEEALRTQREEAQRILEAERAIRVQIEERAKRYALEGELARTLASQPLVAGGAEQLTQLWRDQFLVEPQGSSFSVRTQDFRSVGDFISAQFSRPEYAHFLRAQNPSGGTGGGMATQMPHTTPPNPATDAQPKNMSEAVLLQMAAMAKNTADPRLTPTVGMGLRPLTKQA
jgi:hypothetical protein